MSRSLIGFARISQMAQRALAIRGGRAAAATGAATRGLAAKRARAASVPRRRGRTTEEVLGRLAEPLTKRELSLLEQEPVVPLTPHECALLGQTPTAPRPAVAGQCWAGAAQGRRCVLARGHYRDTYDAMPSPHLDADGVAWFGASPGEEPASRRDGR